MIKLKFSPPKSNTPWPFENLTSFTPASSYQAVTCSASFRTHDTRDAWLEIAFVISVERSQRAAEPCWPTTRDAIHMNTPSNAPGTNIQMSFLLIITIKSNLYYAIHFALRAWATSPCSKAWAGLPAQLVFLAFRSELKSWPRLKSITYVYSLRSKIYIILIFLNL
jgi:hypothetical protein